MGYAQMFSKVGLVGVLFMLDKKGGGIAEEPLGCHLAIRDGDDDTELISGKLPKGNSQWFSSEELTADKRKEIAGGFGEGFASSSFDPYNYGEKRYFIPNGSFCSKVEAEMTYALRMELSDGRKSDAIIFTDLHNVCAGLAQGDGDALLAEWGLPAGGEVAAPKKSKKKTKSKKKRKKGKKSKKRKKRR
jgi:hypothetical protein